MRYWLICLIDWLDEHLLGHRWYWLCDRIGASSWWETQPPDEVVDGVSIYYGWHGRQEAP